MKMNIYEALEASRVSGTMMMLATPKIKRALSLLTTRRGLTEADIRNMPAQEMANLIIQEALINSTFRKVLINLIREFLEEVEDI